MFVHASEWERGIKRLRSHTRWMVVRKQGFGVEIVFQNDAPTTSSVRGCMSCRWARLYTLEITRLKCFEIGFW
jgi:hypothetical protein